ncbi:hypothetical protein ARTSIC4J27_975 [Pseudarthrobacter siccitolerans]|uniref:Uncharacterized protein n=1 Tax=Pseudarthrobacter siccitolerans TaxID=861266 RepID=A0A024GZ71_9MICC|nr:hypothetical protein ARTSIC4J27_975 [Pseudarthrobacter siccitolerans]
MLPRCDADFGSVLPQLEASKKVQLKLGVIVLRHSVPQ